MNTPVIGKEEIERAAATLEKYRAAKSALDRRVTENEKLFRVHTPSANGAAGRSAWLFNSIINKHADIMDCPPECTVLPRERGDEKTAAALTKIIPAVLERAQWEKVYSDAAMYKLKTGTAVYSVLWNSAALDGKGDIDIKQVDLLNLFWEPGVRDIQKSRYVFCTELCDNDVLIENYPFLEGKLGAAKYAYSYGGEMQADLTGKSEVADMYYKKRSGGKTVLHFCKFTCGELIYASENDPEYSERGWYDHGRYPFVFDPLFREQDSPAGFGFIDVMKNAQNEIDLLDAEIMRSARLSARKRFFTRVEGAVNEEEFADFNRDFIHVRGSSLGEDSIREIECSPVSPVCISVLNNKISELKETSGNRDFSQGSTVGGVTSGTAISALQEAGNKLSRDMINASYRAFSEICGLCIGLIRQFYTVTRCIRVTGSDGAAEYIPFDSSFLQPRTDGVMPFENIVPEFDVSVRAHKKDTFSRDRKNNDALGFFKLGFFDPERKKEALACLEIMDLDEKEKLKRIISEG